MTTKTDIDEVVKIMEDEAFTVTNAPPVVTPPRTRDQILQEIEIFGAYNNVDTTTCHNEGLRRALVRGWENLYMRDIRANPEKYYGSKYLDLHGDLLNQEDSNSPTVFITINPPEFTVDLFNQWWKDLQVSMQSWKWVNGYEFYVEKSPKGRLHLHGRLQQDIHLLRFPSDIITQMSRWTIAWCKRREVDCTGHNRKHYHVSRKYDVKGWKEYCSKQTTNPHTFSREKNEKKNLNTSNKDGVQKKANAKKKVRKT